MSNHWYAVYTARYAEEKLNSFFTEFCIENELDYESYLPMVTESKRWSDREKVRSVPLFRNYLFLKHDDAGFHRVKMMPGFSDYIRFGKYPDVVPDHQIQMIKDVILVDQSVTCKPSTMIKGQRVRVKSGALEGYEGLLIEDQINSKVAIEIKHLNQSLQVSIPIVNTVKI